MFKLSKRNFNTEEIENLDDFIKNCTYNKNSERMSLDQLKQLILFDEYKIKF